jgi:dihydrofolate reductase
MRKIVAEMAISLDGYFEGPEGEMDWILFEREIDYANNLLKRFDTMFFGRKTYQRFGFPRMVEGIEHAGKREFNNTVNNMRKYVFTNTLNHVPGNGMVINRNVPWEVERIRDEEGKDIWLCGGANVISTFAAMNLIDEYLIAIHPVLLSDGRPLFSDISNKMNLDLKCAETLNSGIVILNYEVN